MSIRNDEQTRKAGYFLGVVTQPDKVVNYNGDLIVAAHGKLYDCHAYHPTLNGYGIRKVVDCDRKEKLPETVLIALDLIDKDKHG